MNRILRFFLKSFYYLLYHQLAWTYDAVAYLVSGGRWFGWGNEIDTFLTGSTVLELGFGTGHHLIDLYRKGYSFYGMDSSSQMAALARKRLNFGKNEPTLVQGNSDSMPFNNECFDSVLAIFPSEYIFQLWTISETARVLRPDGRLVALLSVKFCPTSQCNRFLSFTYSFFKQNPPDELQISKFLQRLSQYELNGKCFWYEFEDYELLFLICNKVNYD